MFWKKSESEDLTARKKLYEIEQKIILIETTIESLKTNMNSLRGLVNRRMGVKEEEIKEEKTENNKYSMFVP